MRVFTLIELAIVIVIAAILAAVAIPIYQGIVDDSKWSEGKTAIGTIKNAVDVYLASNNDFAQLLTDAGVAVADKTAVAVNTLEQNLGMGSDSLASLQYFLATDFTIAVDKAAGAPVYHIVVTCTGTGDQPSTQGYGTRGVHKTGTTVTWYKAATTAATGTELLPATYVTW